MIGRIQQAIAAAFLGVSVVLSVPAVSLAASQPTAVHQQDAAPPSLTPAQQQAYLDSVEQQILQGVMQVDPAKIELAQAVVGAIRGCLNSQLAAGKSLGEAAEFCGDIVQQAISPGDGVQEISPEDRQWLGQADAGLRNRARNQGWDQQDTENASLLTTGCIARFLKAGAPKEEGLQKCSFAFTIWREARDVAEALKLP